MCGLVLVFALSLGREDVELRARTELERAEALVRDGRYEEARRAYERLARDEPATSAGREAQLRSKPSAYLGWADVLRHGPSSNRFDVVIMGDGFVTGDLPTFDKLAANVPQYFDLEPTLHEYFDYFNFALAVLVSKDEGVDGFGRDYDTALGAFTRPTGGGVVGVDPLLVRAALARIADNDGQVIVLVKQGLLGGGREGVAILGSANFQLLPHEVGHALFGLGDESPSTEHRCGEDRLGGPNTSADPHVVAWQHWIDARHPGVGVFEGAAGRLTGAWRPGTGSCAMTENRWYCVVCREAVVLRIHAFVDPIEACTPPVQPKFVREPYVLGSEGRSFEVQVMQPATHALEVRWWILDESSMPHTKVSPKSADTASSDPRIGRAARGPLPAIDARPVHVGHADEHGRSRLDVRREGLVPGVHRVVCRAKDTTRLRGETWPLVLDDPAGLLESERGWWIEVPARDRRPLTSPDSERNR